MAEEGELLSVEIAAGMMRCYVFREHEEDAPMTVILVQFGGQNQWQSVKISRTGTRSAIDGRHRRTSATLR